MTGQRGTGRRAAAVSCGRDAPAGPDARPRPVPGPPAACVLAPAVTLGRSLVTSIITNNSQSVSAPDFSSQPNSRVISAGFNQGS